MREDALDCSALVACLTRPCRCEEESAAVMLVRVRCTYTVSQLLVSVDLRHSRSSDIAIHVLAKGRRSQEDDNCIRLGHPDRLGDSPSPSRCQAGQGITEGINVHCKLIPAPLSALLLCQRGSGTDERVETPDLLIITQDRPRAVVSYGQYRHCTAWTDTSMSSRLRGAEGRGTCPLSKRFLRLWVIRVR